MSEKKKILKEKKAAPFKVLEGQNAPQMPAQHQRSCAKYKDACLSGKPKPVSNASQAQKSYLIKKSVIDALLEHSSVVFLSFSVKRRGCKRRWTGNGTLKLDDPWILVLCRFVPVRDVFTTASHKGS
jgi:hypothetical protein